VVSKSEGRYENLLEIKPSQKAFDLAKSLNREPAFIELILNESNEIISTEKNVIIVEHKLGFININAGIDRSNIPENKNIVLLLPEDPSLSSQKIYEDISSKTNKNISVIITDSMTRPYRSGVTNFALASANIQSLIDLKGEKDIYGNILQATEIAIADELAAAAGLLMGQGSEGMPIVIIRGFDRTQYAKNDAFDLIVKKEDDLYR
jgi:coenzyme F420-0:L-glutamate ligase/coenzyme F420-1:gamma-L-glutamate ligase